MADWADNIAKALLAGLLATVSAIGALLWRDSRQIALNIRDIEANTKGSIALKDALDAEVEARKQRDEENTREHQKLRESIAAVAQLGAIQEVRRESAESDGNTQWRKIEEMTGEINGMKLEMTSMKTMINERFTQLFTAAGYNRRKAERGSDHDT